MWKNLIWFLNNTLDVCLLVHNITSLINKSADWSNNYQISQFSANSAITDITCLLWFCLINILIQRVNERNLTDVSTLFLSTTQDDYSTSLSGTCALVLTGSADVSTIVELITVCKCHSVWTQTVVLYVKRLQSKHLKKKRILENRFKIFEFSLIEFCTICRTWRILLVFNFQYY